MMSKPDFVLCHILRQRHPTAVLDVAGTGPDRDRLERLSGDLGLGGSVRFLGPVENETMPTLYRSTDIALNPSLVDNMPISILEALASGVPVVSTSSGGVPAMVKAGEEAILVPPRSPESMASAVSALWEAPERIGGAAGSGPAKGERLRMERRARGLAAGVRPGGIEMSYTWLVSSVLFPLHELAKGHDTLRLRRSLERSQWWTAEELEFHQLERLQSLLYRAAKRVPYYSRLFNDLRFDPEAMESLRDLERLPLLTKDIIRKNLEDLKAGGARLSLFNTGGSTGEPLQFFIGRERVSHDVAAKWRATRWWGVDIGDPEIVVWGSPIELGAQDRIRELRDRVLRTHLLPAFEMSEKRLDEFVDRICAIRPKMIFGYPSALSLIAGHASARGRYLRSAGIKVAFVTAEQLFEHQKRAIAETFGCAVANGYGGRDLGFAAHECPDGGLHVTAEDIVDRDRGRRRGGRSEGTEG